MQGLPLLFGWLGERGWRGRSCGLRPPGSMENHWSHLLSPWTKESFLDFMDQYNLLVDLKFCLHFKNHTKLQQNVSLLSTVSFILQKKKIIFFKNFKSPKIGQFQKEGEPSKRGSRQSHPTALVRSLCCRWSGRQSQAPRPFPQQQLRPLHQEPGASSSRGVRQLPQAAQEAACWVRCLQLPLSAVGSSWETPGDHASHLCPLSEDEPSSGRAPSEATTMLLETEKQLMITMADK